MLASALQDRGDMLCQHEIVHDRYVETFGNGPDVGRRIYRNFWRRPQLTWDRSVLDVPYNLDCDISELAAAGCIIHRTAGDLIPRRGGDRSFCRGIWRAIADDADVKIVFLHRENQLKRRLSEMLALPDTWQRYASSRTDQRIAVRPTEEGLFRYFDRYDEFYAAAKVLFRGHDSIEVVYEELTRDPQRVLHGVQAFLGLEPMDVYPRTFKGEHRPLTEIISNYSWFAQKLRKTRFARFLDDEPDPEVEAHVKPTITGASQ
jgi:hypothetical protein